MGIFSKDEETETPEVEELKEIKEVQESKKEPKKRKRGPKTKTTKTVKRAPKRKEPVTTSAPSTKAATTIGEFTRIMAVYRNQTVPARFNKNNLQKYVEPLQGNYQGDIFDPYEVKGIDYWVTELDYATRYPVSGTYTFTATGATVTPNGDDFTIEMTADTATLTLDQGTADDGWYVCTADVSGQSSFQATFSTDVEVSLTPRIKGKLRYTSYITGAGTLEFTITSKTGEIITLNNFKFYRLAHNIS